MAADQTIDFQVWTDQTTNSSSPLVPILCSYPMRLIQLTKISQASQKFYPAPLAWTKIWTKGAQLTKSCTRYDPLGSNKSELPYTMQPLHLLTSMFENNIVQSEDKYLHI